MQSPSPFHLPIKNALAALPKNEAGRFVILAEQASLTIELYQPVKQDLQQPHDRDECYVIVDGSGDFKMGTETVPFAPGDFLFVPAGMEHRFVNFGNSMTCWVIFYGPVGGERIESD